MGKMLMFEKCSYRTGQDRTGTWYIVVRSSKKMEKEKVAID
jgi:hypothetical protein